MKYGMFAVRDSKSEIFMTPQLYQTKGVARRAFEDAANKSDSPFNRHPEDYALFYLGTYEETTGKFESLAQPESLGLAIDFIKDQTRAMNSSSNLKSVQ